MAPKKPKKFRFIDLFCGIGGFHQAAKNVEASANGSTFECVFASDIDLHCRDTYEANYGLRPDGDITKVEASKIPNHDLLFAGFPCQPFSIIGNMRGFEDSRGTLFFDIARILEAKRPKGFILENVKLLAGHDNGRTLKRIMRTLDDLGYDAQHKVLNALDYGVPQKRERTIIVGVERKRVSKGLAGFQWPAPVKHRLKLEDILEPNSKIKQKYYWASDMILNSRKAKVKKPPVGQRTIWHENKAGNVSALPYSCALRAGASYNYLLVDGVRRPTEREMLQLQGFPRSFKTVYAYAVTRKQAGNSVPVPMIQAVIEKLIDVL